MILQNLESFNYLFGPQGRELDQKIEPEKMIAFVMDIFDGVGYV